MTVENLFARYIAIRPGITKVGNFDWMHEQMISTKARFI